MRSNSAMIPFDGGVCLSELTRQGTRLRKVRRCRVGHRHVDGRRVHPYGCFVDGIAGFQPTHDQPEVLITFHIP